MADEDDRNESSKYLANFLFGNINESGELENDDLLDNESKKSLVSIERFGLDEIITEILDEAKENKNTDNVNHVSDHKDQNGEVNIKSENEEDNEDDAEYNIKSPSAIDYSDINELAEEFLEQSVIKREDDTTDYDADDEGPGFKNDSQLMPPPPPINDKENKDSAANDEENKKRKLETPLAAMLPSKYADVDVRELFPDFRVDKVK